MQYLSLGKGSPDIDIYCVFWCYLPTILAMCLPPDASTKYTVPRSSSDPAGVLMSELVSDPMSRPGMPRNDMLGSMCFIDEPSFAITLVCRSHAYCVQIHNNVGQISVLKQRVFSAPLKLGPRTQNAVKCLFMGKQNVICVIIRVLAT